MVLRAKDSATAQAWFSAIHTTVSDLLTHVIAEAREQLGPMGLAGGREIRHLGWLAEKVRKHPHPGFFPRPSQHMLQPLKSGASFHRLSLSLGLLVRLQRVCIMQELCVFSNFVSPQTVQHVAKCRWSLIAYCLDE